MTKKLAWEGETNRSVAGVCLVLLSFALVVSLSSQVRAWAEEPAELVPSGWAPSLELLKSYLEAEAEAKERKSQQFLNRTSQTMADLLDAQLFITYILLMQTLNEKERTDLFNEQKQWLGKREKFASAAVVSKGGTLAPLEYSGVFRKITEERLAELAKHLAQQKATTDNRRGKREE
jgi:uncharacterized protein YecT (DUF1311 family)